MWKKPRPNVAAAIFPVYQSLQDILARRKKMKTEIVVDGYGSFLLLDKDDKKPVSQKMFRAI